MCGVFWGAWELPKYRQKILAVNKIRRTDESSTNTWTYISVPLTVVIPAYLFSCRSEAKSTENCEKRGEMQVL